MRTEVGGNKSFDKTVGNQLFGQSKESLKLFDSNEKEKASNQVNPSKTKNLISGNINKQKIITG